MQSRYATITSLSFLFHPQEWVNQAFWTFSSMWPSWSTNTESTAHRLYNFSIAIIMHRAEIRTTFSDTTLATSNVKAQPVFLFFFFWNEENIRHNTCGCTDHFIFHVKPASRFRFHGNINHLSALKWLQHLHIVHNVVDYLEISML